MKKEENGKEAPISTFVTIAVILILIIAAGVFIALVLGSQLGL